MSFTVEHFEFYLLIIMRMAGFIFTAPFFSYTAIQRKIKALFAVMISFVVIFTVPYTPLNYVGTIGFAALAVKETVVGITIGFVANLCLYIINFAGSIMDMEIGFSMVNVLNPVTNAQTTISGSLYTYLVMLLMIVTNMHHYILRAVIESYTLVPIGTAVIGSKVTDSVVLFLTDFFSIGFRIVLPIFGCMLVINVILGVLTRMAPQMNMFVVGMQLKVLAGIVVLVFVVSTIPSVADFIFAEMKQLVSSIIHGMAPS